MNLQATCIVFLCICVSHAFACPKWTHFSQCDSRWGSDELGTSSNTICSAGCAMSSVAMALNSFGKGYNPGTFNSWLKSHGGYASGDLIVWGACSALGMTVNKIVYSLSAADLSAYVRSCHPVVVNVRQGTHWVLVTGVTKQTDVFAVNDPGFSQTTYTLGEMLEFVIYNPAKADSHNQTLQTEHQSQVAMLSDAMATDVESDIEAPENTCGGNCPSNDCKGCPCGTRSNYQNVKSWCAKHNWNQQCCQCIMTHESSGNANAANYNTDGSIDAGMFQINSVNWKCNGGHAPCDPTANFNCAVSIYQAWGNRWDAWSTCGGCGCC